MAAIKIKKVEMGATKGWRVKYDYEKQLEELMKFISNSSVVSLGTYTDHHTVKVLRRQILCVSKNIDNIKKHPGDTLLHFPFSLLGVKCMTGAPVTCRN